MIEVRPLIREGNEGNFVYLVLTHAHSIRSRNVQYIKDKSKFGCYTDSMCEADTFDTVSKAKRFITRASDFSGLRVRYSILPVTKKKMFKMKLSGDKA